MALRRISVNPGDRYGKLTVISEANPSQWNKYKIRMVLCKCECGRITTVRLDYLRSGHTQSCGCNRKDISSKVRITHRKTGTRIYQTWAGMLSRCRNERTKSYKYYGAKGVSVCSEWLEFEPFYQWALKNGYRDDLTIDRINPYGNYEPSNCRWIPKSEQYLTRRSVVGEKHA